MQCERTMAAICGTSIYNRERGSADLLIASITVPDLSIRPIQQRYSCLVACPAFGCQYNHFSRYIDQFMGQHFILGCYLSIDGWEPG
jgi:hypothetical protein